MRVYISGPMGGIPDFNYPRFNKAAAELRRLGYIAVNPAEINSGPMPDPHGDATVWKEFYNFCLRRDIQALCDCRFLVLLPGWEMSAGANLELNIAHRVGIRPYIYNDFLNAHYRGEVQE